MESLADIRQSEYSLASLPPFMPVSMALLDILSREDAVIEQVAALLQLDSEFVGEVLDLANSRAFGFQSQITSLAHAVVLLGTRRLQALILTASLRRSGKVTGAPDFWRHSVASAFAAAEMASGWSVNPDTAYTAALLHDMGTWQALAGCAAEDVPDGLRRCREEADVDLIHAACRISEALGFSEAAGVREEEVAEVGVFPAMRLNEEQRVLLDPTSVAEAVREKMRFIGN